MKTTFSAQTLHEVATDQALARRTIDELAATLPALERDAADDASVLHIGRVARVHNKLARLHHHIGEHGACLAHADAAKRGYTEIDRAPAVFLVDLLAATANHIDSGLPFPTASLVDDAKADHPRYLDMVWEHAALAAARDARIPPIQATDTDEIGTDEIGTDEIGINATAIQRALTHLAEAATLRAVRPNPNTEARQRALADAIHSVTATATDGADGADGADDSGDSSDPIGSIGSMP